MICVPDHPTSGKFQTFKLHAKLPAIKSQRCEHKADMSFTRAASGLDSY